MGRIEGFVVGIVLVGAVAGVFYGFALMFVGAQKADRCNEAGGVVVQTLCLNPATRQPVNVR